MKVLKLRNLSKFLLNVGRGKTKPKFVDYFLYTSSAAEFMKWVLILSSYEKEMATEIPCYRVTKMN